MGNVAFFSENAQGCSEISSALPPGTDILLVDRGSCYFVEKAFHAQAAGAKAVVVADNVQEDLLTMAVPEDLPALAALTGKIAIPTVLVTKQAGEQIKALLRKPEAGGTTLELDWSDSIAHPDSRVEWEFWFTANSACGPMCAAQQAFLRALPALRRRWRSRGLPSSLRA